MNYIIISTCGSSILTNRADQELVKIINKYSNIKEDEIMERDLESYNKIEKYIEERKDFILSQSIEDVKKMSAELNGIFSFYFKLDNLNIEERKRIDSHYLILTDTYIGKKTGDIVKSYLEKQNFMNIIPLVIRDLSTKTFENFLSGAGELVKEMKDIYESKKGNENIKIIYNLTGGFKSVNGFMQTLSMFYADETIYLFETGTELLRLPKLPVKLDEDEVVDQNFEYFRKVSLGLINTYPWQDNIPDIYFYRLKDEFELSPSYGAIVYDKIKEKKYKEKVYEPVINKIKFSEPFRNSVKNLESWQYYQLNIQIDRLTKYLINKNSLNHQNLRSLNFHRLTNVRGKSTHEFYAYSHMDAKRIYCHFENNNGEEVLILDEFGEHL